MNRQSTLLSIFGHIAIFAIILLWGIQWPFQPREVKIDTVEIIDNASFDALIAQATSAQNNASQPEETLVPTETQEVAPQDDLPVISEEPVEIEIIQDIPAAPVAPTRPPAPVAPAVPGIGDAAPRTAIAPPPRPVAGEVQPADTTPADEITQLVETVTDAPADVPPPPRDEIGDAVEAVIGDLAGEDPVAAPVSAAPDTAPIPPARIATTEDNTNVETVAPDVTAGEGTAVEENTEVENTPTPAPEVAPAAPAAPIVSAPPTPPARDAGSLNIVETAPVPAEPSVDDLVAQVASEVTQTDTAPTPEPEPTPEPVAAPTSTVAPNSAPVPPARTGNLNVVSNAAPAAPVVAQEATPDAASEILAQLEGAAVEGNQGRDLSRIETGAILQQIAKNWSIAPIADKANLSELVVVVGFSVDANGALNSPITMLDPSSPNGDQIAAFQTAERAVLNSMPLQLPSDVDPNGVKWTLTFDPTNQSVGLV